MSTRQRLKYQLEPAQLAQAAIDLNQAADWLLAHRTGTAEYAISQVVPEQTYAFDSRHTCAVVALYITFGIGFYNWPDDYRKCATQLNECAALLSELAKEWP